MDINIIDGAIKQLEESETSFENVRELACLYIVKQHLNGIIPNENTQIELELNDILPQYREYCKVKTRYQLKEITKEPVIDAMKALCKEIQEFIQALYSSTDFYNERRLILDMIDRLDTQYTENKAG